MRDRMTSSNRASRPTNLALLFLVPIAVLTGLFANTIGLNWILDPATIHGAVAIAIALLTPWKSIVVRKGLAHRRSRWASLLLLGLVLTTVSSGLIHSTGLTDRIGPLTVMQVHIGSAVIALVLLVSHYRSHPVRPRATDLDRRAFLRAGGIGVAAGAVWLGWEGVNHGLGLRGADRRFTGSHERGSFDPSGLPATSWLDDRVQHIDPGEWRLTVDGRLLSLDDVAAIPHDDLTAILDCTSGWYSEQVWTGLRLDRIVTAGERRSLEVRSATGYARRFPTTDLERLWLVTQIGGEPLAPGNGFPARIVAPGRRGFWWVKWVTQITTSDLPWWVQSPFPVT